MAAVVTRTHVKHPEGMQPEKYLSGYSICELVTWSKMQLDYTIDEGTGRGIPSPQTT